MTREHVLLALEHFITQRPGIDPRNYTSGNDHAGRKAYHAESRRVTRDRHDAERLLRAVALSSMPLDTLLGGFRAFSGRLTIQAGKDGGVELSYCTGQYFPTEYRRAVCAVLSSALFDFYRDGFVACARSSESPGDAIRRCFAQEFGLRFARRWFDA